MVVTAEVFGKLGLAVIVAIVGGIAMVAAWLACCCFLNWACRSKAERVAIHQFKREFPDEHFGFSAKVKDSDRTVVMIAYGSTRPPHRKYYFVDVDNMTATVVENDSKYRPKYDR